MKIESKKIMAIMLATTIMVGGSYTGLINTESIIGTNAIVEAYADGYDTSNKLSYIEKPDGTLEVFGSYDIKGNVTIPESIDNKIVTSIGKSAFSAKSITSVSMPDSIEEIKELAFYDCRRLESISLSSNLKKIGNTAFKYCKLLDNIKMPNSIQDLGAGIFSKCSYLKNITLPDNLAELPSGMFEDCTALTDIKIPETVTTIDKSVFTGCTGINEIIISENVEKINDSVFFHCFNLDTIKIHKPKNSITGAPWDAPSSTKILWLEDLQVDAEAPVISPTNLAGLQFEGDFAAKDCIIEIPTIIEGDEENYTYEWKLYNIELNDDKFSLFKEGKEIHSNTINLGRLDYTQEVDGLPLGLRGYKLDIAIKDKDDKKVFEIIGNGKDEGIIIVSTYKFEEPRIVKQLTKDDLSFSFNTPTFGGYIVEYLVDNTVVKQIQLNDKDSATNGTYVINEERNFNFSDIDTTNAKKVGYKITGMAFDFNYRTDLELFDLAEDKTLLNTKTTIRTGDWSNGTGAKPITPIEYSITLDKSTPEPPVEVNPATPVITKNLSEDEVTYNLGDSSNELEVKSTVSDSGTLSYQWFANDVELPGEINNTYTPSTKEIGTSEYYCQVTNTLEGKTAIAKSNTAIITVKKVDNGEDNKPQEPLVNAKVPVITKDLDKSHIDTTVNKGSIDLTIEAESQDDGGLSYQWLKDGNIIDGETKESLTIDTSQTGTHLYKCLVTNTLDIATGDKTATISSKTVSITVEPKVSEPSNNRKPSRPSKPIDENTTEEKITDEPADEIIEIILPNPDSDITEVPGTENDYIYGKDKDGNIFEVEHHYDRNKKVHIIKILSDYFIIKSSVPLETTTENPMLYKEVINTGAIDTSNNFSFCSKFVNHFGLDGIKKSIKFYLTK